jgi:hypothetical protein
MSKSGCKAAAEYDSSPLLNAQPVEPVTFYSWIVLPANLHIDFWSRQRQGDTSRVSRGIKRQTVIFDIISLWKVICLLILLHVSYFLIPVTKLWDMIICLCMCKGQMHHVKVLESKSRKRMAKTFHFYLQATIKWQSKSYMSDEMN